jgi:hypothetical protein
MWLSQRRQFTLIRTKAVQYARHTSSNTLPEFVNLTSVFQLPAEVNATRMVSLLETTLFPNPADVAPSPYRRSG